MPIEVTDLGSLTPADVQAQQAEIVQRLMEDNSGLDLRRGAFHDLIAYYHAVLSTADLDTINRYQRSSSLLAITEDPTLADDDIVDNALSNYRVTRNSAQNATGSIVIVISRFQSVTIGAGAVFQAEDKQFQTLTSFTARKEELNVVAATDRLLTQLSDGNYAFTIEVTALEAGAESQIRKDTLLLPTTPPVSFVRAYAAEDFTGGVSAETNEELLTKLALGVASRTSSGRVTMNAFLTSEDNYPNVVATSIIGAGDAEMPRDKHTILPIGLRGKVDWYVQSEQLPQRLGLTKTATLIEKTVDNYGIWQFTLTRDESPGLYKVERVVQVGADAIVTGSYTITEDIRGVDLTEVDGLDLVPDIVDVMEGAFTRYQYVTIRFKDTDTLTLSLALGAQRDYSVTTLGMSALADMQLLVGSRASRHPGGDILVKAPIPAFVKLSFEILLPKGQTQPSVDSIKTDMAALVNTQGFTGRLPASALYDVIHNYLTKPASTSKIQMLAEIMRPDGSMLYINSDEVLLVPDDPFRLVTPRTVIFFLDPADIGITVRTLDAPPV